MELSKMQQFALGTVAKHFSAPWQSGEGPPDAYVIVAGRRVGVDIAVLPRQRPGRDPVPKPRFRDDAVARRVLRNLDTAVQAHVPGGKTLVLTLGAPIKEPKKLLAALTKMLLSYLRSGAEDVAQKRTLLGNRVRFLLASDGLRANSKLTAFVFSGDPKPGVLLNAMRSLQAEITAHAKKRLPGRFSADLWLVLVSDQWIADIKTYRWMYAQLAIPDRFAKILAVLEGGRVQLLSPSRVL
jgi:hypothetical protein